MRPRNTITLIFLGACLVGWLIWFWPKDYADSPKQPDKGKASVTEVDKPASSLALDAGPSQAKPAGEEPAPQK